MPYIDKRASFHVVVLIYGVLPLRLWCTCCHWKAFLEFSFFFSNFQNANFLRKCSGKLEKLSRLIKESAAANVLFDFQTMKIREYSKRIKTYSRITLSVTFLKHYFKNGFSLRLSGTGTVKNSKMFLETFVFFLANRFIACKVSYIFL